MKKIYLPFLTLLIFLNSTIAQNDPNAKKVLDAVSAKVKSFKGITANFSIKSVSSKGKDNTAKTGTIAIKGQKYWLKQGKNEIICDGTNIYNFDGNKTITKSLLEESNQTLSPQNLLSNFYDKDFNYKLISTAGNVNEIELTPIDKRKSFQKVNIFIDKKKSMITKAKVLDKSNNTLEFVLSNLNTAANLPDPNFQFVRSKYPKDAEILD
ncbi:MAG: outer membrane lipoprotein carrier protein LolA [Bacteroidetes bacterium]|nr:outer membrane lipoprotein carrier protein LolA [Bacteroidota bacterium]